MKKITFAIIIACLVCTAAFSQAKHGYSFSQNSNGGETKSVFESDEDGLHIKVEYTGTITLNDSETAIQSISAGGLLKFWKNESRLVAQSDGDGVVHYKLYDNGEELAQPGERATKFIAMVVKELIALGFDAQRHVARLYKRGGATAVLAEVGGLRSDYIKQVYLGELLKTGNLTTAEMNAVAKTTAALSGNYEKGQVLQKFAGAFLRNPETVQGYFDAAGSINGSYEKGQVLQAALKEHLTNTALEQLLQVAATIGGNYEKGQVLQAALMEQLTKTGVGQLLAAAATIGGDYEKAEVLKKVTRVQGLGEENCNKLLNDADAIHGAYEKAGVLTAVIDNDTLSKASFNLLVQVAGRISGAYEKSGVFKALAVKAAWTTDEWINLVNAAASVTSAYEKSGVLIAIAGKMPADTKIHAAYMETAKTIGSNYEYEQAVNAAK